MGITLSAVVVNYIRRQWRGLYLVTLPGGKSEQHYVSPRGGMLADINCRLIRFACTWTCRQTTWRPASPLSCGLMRLVSVALFVLSVLVRTVYVSPHWFHAFCFTAVGMFVVWPCPCFRYNALSCPCRDNAHSNTCLTHNGHITRSPASAGIANRPLVFLGAAIT